MHSNKNKTISVDYSDISNNNFETGIGTIDLSIKSCSDDASNEAESIDSGCVPDLIPETNWLQISSTLKYEYNFITELLHHRVSKCSKTSSTSETKSTKPTVNKLVRLSDVEERAKRKEKKALKKAKRVEEEKSKLTLGEVSKPEGLRFDVGKKKKLESELRKLKSGKKGNLSNSQAKKREMKLKKALTVMERKREKALKKVKRAENVLQNNTRNQQTAGNKKIYNNSGQLVFSKFDFSQGAKETWKENKKPDLNYYMAKVIKEKEKIKSLQSQGKVSDAVNCIEKRAWNKAMKKAQGEKVKDDPQKLKKSMDKKMKQKKKSQGKWNERLNNVKKDQEKRQEKRKQNISAKKEKRQQKKLKGKKKKGGNGARVPGF